jgi:hypothetical protein
MGLAKAWHAKIESEAKGVDDDERLWAMTNLAAALCEHGDYAEAAVRGQTYTVWEICTCF